MAKRTKSSLREHLKVGQDIALEEEKEGHADLLGWLAARADGDISDEDLWQRGLGTVEHEYLEWLKDTAEEIVKDAEGDREEAIEGVWENADGSAWVIYTYRAIQVLLITKNEDHWFDAGYGELGDSFSEAITRLAFAAVNADLGEAVEEALDEYEEAEEDEEDEDE